MSCCPRYQVIHRSKQMIELAATDQTTRSSKQYCKAKSRKCATTASHGYSTHFQSVSKAFRTRIRSDWPVLGRPVTVLGT